MARERRIAKQLRVPVGLLDTLEELRTGAQFTSLMVYLLELTLWFALGRTHRKRGRPDVADIYEVGTPQWGYATQIDRFTYELIFIVESVQERHALEEHGSLQKRMFEFWDECHKDLNLLLLRHMEVLLYVNHKEIMSNGGKCAN